LPLYTVGVAKGGVAFGHVVGFAVQHFHGTKRAGFPPMRKAAETCEPGITPVDTTVPDQRDSRACLGYEG
jgi:hypothetical protein